MKTLIGKDFPKQVIPLINSAKSSISIIVFDWRMYPNDPAHPVQLFNQALIRAARRGVKVRAIANNLDIISILNANGIEAKKPPVSNLIHIKIMILDDKDVVLGSHNYTQSAFTANFEISTYIPDYPDVDNLKTFFNNMFNLHG
jgi:phosphatidylserine/phosphatidylglycerophosphate/cardiolipin synthase-like enzyme